MEIIEKRENLELIKKVLNYYTDFVIKRKFNDIIKGIGNVEDLKNNVFDSQDEITKKRIILNFIKKKGLLITAKLMLKKRKQDNIKKMLYFIKEYIKKNYEKINEFNNTEELEYNDYMKNLNLQKEIEKIYQENLKCEVFQNMKEYLIEKNNEFLKTFELDFTTIFMERKENFYEIYSLQIIAVKDNQLKNIDNFMNKLKESFKSRIKKILFNTFYFNCENKDSFDIDNLKKIKDIAKLQFNEYNFTDGIKQTILKLKNIAEIYLFYANNQEILKYLFFYLHYS
jgi:hypothetical protein